MENKPNIVDAKGNLVNPKSDSKNESKTIVSKPAAVVQKTGWAKLKDQFITSDGKKVGDYVIFDVLLPAVKKTFADMVTNGINMLLFGNSRPYGYQTPDQKPQYDRPSYRGYWESSVRKQQYEKNSNPYFATNIELYSEEDARKTLEEMRYRIVRSGSCSVLELYDMIGCPSDYTDDYYGWNDLRRAGIIDLHNGKYLLDLPRPLPLNR